MAEAPRASMLGFDPIGGDMDKTKPAQVGDLIVITGHRVGEAEQIGEILEVLGEPPDARYRVRWGDDHESVFYPGSDATIRRATHPRPVPEKKR
jgi:hypothetical protein